MLSKQPAEKYHDTVMDDTAPSQRSLPRSELLSISPDPKRGVCIVCGDIRRTDHHSTGFVQATEADVCAAAETGCPTCSLISKATTIFCSSLIDDESELTRTLKIDAVTILQDKGHLSFRLFIKKHDAVRGEVSLDLFSPRSMLGPGFWLFVMLIETSSYPVSSPPSP